MLTASEFSLILGPCSDLVGNVCVYTNQVDIYTYNYVIYSLSLNLIYQSINQDKYVFILLFLILMYYLEVHITPSCFVHFKFLSFTRRDL